MIETILYFGSFNPIHLGHISLAESVLEQTKADRLWFIVSPQNPFKSTTELANEQDRLSMVRIAISDSKYASQISGSDIEFDLPRPSRSIDTINVLEQRHHDHKFTLLIGSDNVADFDKWKDYQTILRKYKVLVYPRDGYTNHNAISESFTYLDKVALYPHAASSVRERIKNNQSIEQELNTGVVNYIKDHGLYGFTR